MTIALVLGLLFGTAHARSGGGFASGQPVEDPTSRAGLVRHPTTLDFWDPDRGVLGTGLATEGVCRGGTLAITDDGGRTFRSVLGFPGTVEYVTTAGVNDAWARIESCDLNDRKFRIVHTTDGGLTWRTLPASEAFAPSFASPTQGLAFAGPGMGQVIDHYDYAAPAELLATSDGGRTWRPTHTPCAAKVHGTVSDRVLLSFATPTYALAECGGLNAGSSETEFKTMFLSRDGGRHWRDVARITKDGPFDDRSAFSHFGSAFRLFATPDGFALFSISDYLYTSTNFGRDWGPPPLFTYPKTFPHTPAAVVSKDLSFRFSTRSVRCCVEYYSPRTSLQVSRDGGETWDRVSSWPALHYRPTK